jgi:hypothetical protein
VIRAALLMALVALAGCAAPGFHTGGSCSLAAADELQVQLTTRTDDGKRQVFLLNNSWQEQRLAVIAMDPVGAVLFSGELADAAISNQASPLYRGLAPDLLLRVYGWWLQRDNRAPCWQGEGFSARQQADGSYRLSASALEMDWHPEQPELIRLPRHGLQLVFTAVR